MTLKHLKHLFLSLFALCAVVFAGSARADGTSKAAEARAARDDIKKTLGFVPAFFSSFGDSALPGTWQEMKGLQLNPKTALSGRVKELIGLGVSAQVPCRYCIYAHTEFAKLNGASEAEIDEAVAVAASERHWSAILWGRRNRRDQAAYRRRALAEPQEGPERPRRRGRRWPHGARRHSAHVRLRARAAARRVGARVARRLA
ncbi:MAG: carboxymuconolactone decarboxylase family protein [Polyangiaceae bacterium]